MSEVIIVCSDCHKAVPDEDWLKADTYCEDCGYHTAHKCPFCGAIWDDVFEWDVLERVELNGS